MSKSSRAPRAISAPRCLSSPEHRSLELLLLASVGVAAGLAGGAPTQPTGPMPPAAPAPQQSALHVVDPGDTYLLADQGQSCEVACGLAGRDCSQHVNTANTTSHFEVLQVHVALQRLLCRQWT